jgi:hypothetical protein
MEFGESINDNKKKRPEVRGAFKESKLKLS